MLGQTWVSLLTLQTPSFWGATVIGEAADENPILAQLSWMTQDSILRIQGTPLALVPAIPIFPSVYFMIKYAQFITRQCWYSNSNSPIAQMMQTSPANKNENTQRDIERQNLQNEKLDRMIKKNKDYDYKNEMKTSKMNPVKYEKFKPAIPPAQNYRSDLIFNPTNNSDYMKYQIETLTHQQRFEADENRQKDVPTPQVARYNNKQAQVDAAYGRVSAYGSIQAKKHFTGEINLLEDWEQYFYVLRKYTFYFYKSTRSDSQEFQLEIAEKSIDTNMENIQSFAVSDNFYVKKNKNSKAFRKLVMGIAYWRSYLMLYALQDMPPDKLIRDFMQKGSNTLKMQDIRAKPKGYKTFKNESEIVFTFLNSLLEKIQEEKKIKLVQIFFPKQMVYMQNFFYINNPNATLITNVIPPTKHPLKELHLVNISLRNDIQVLLDHLPDIFPPLLDDNYTNRKFSITQSDLDDRHMQRIASRLKAPINQLNFSHNRLSCKGVVTVIEIAGTLQTNVVDVSYNQPAAKISNNEYITSIQQKAQCIKTLKARGSSLMQISTSKFFQALAKSNWLTQIQIDYQPYYNVSMVSELKDFNCEMFA